MDRMSPPDHEFVRRDAPAARRNGEAILAVLRAVLPPDGTVLEIGSGTGQHAAALAPALIPRRWLPSDPDPSQRESIAAWTSDAGPGAPLPVRHIDAAADTWAVGPEDRITAVVSVNVIHIAPWTVAEGLVAGAGRILPPGGVLYFYGPFARGGAHSAPSNAAFDASLRAQNPEWGVRDLDSVTALALAAGFSGPEVIAMPSNNLSIIFRRA